jgi:tRNA nucleotidyltransferase/poly(A) polymerase
MTAGPATTACPLKTPDSYRVCCERVVERVVDQLEAAEFVSDMKDLELSHAAAIASWNAEWGNAMYHRARKAEAGLEDCERELQVCKALLYQELSRSKYAAEQQQRLASEDDYWHQWGAANTIQVAFLRYRQWQQERLARLASDGEAAANSRYIQLKHMRPPHQGGGYRIYNPDQ